MMNDFIWELAVTPPLGNVQMLGKITGPILAASTPNCQTGYNAIAARSLILRQRICRIRQPRHSERRKIKLDW
jgi:hypothetical protein